MMGGRDRLEEGRVDEWIEGRLDWKKEGWMNGLMYERTDNQHMHQYE